MKKLIGIIIVLFLLMALMIITGKPSCERVEAQERVAVPDSLTMSVEYSVGPIMKAVLILEAIKIYREYETECYNDSIYVDEMTFVKIDGEFKTNVWAHAQPTFTDFMEFLEKKYKEK